MAHEQSLRAELEELRLERDRIREERDFYEGDAQRLRAHRDRLRSERNEAEVEADKLRVERDSQRDELDKSKKKVEHLENERDEEVSRLKEENDFLLDDTERLRGERNVLREEAEILEDENDSFFRSAVKYIAIGIELETKISREKAILREQNEKIEKENKTFANKECMLNNRITALQHEKHAAMAEMKILNDRVLVTENLQQIVAAQNQDLVRIHASAILGQIEECKGDLKKLEKAARGAKNISGEGIVKGFEEISCNSCKERIADVSRLIDHVLSNKHKKGHHLPPASVEFFTRLLIEAQQHF